MRKGENTCNNKCSDKFPNCTYCVYNKCMGCEKNYYLSTFGCRYMTDLVPHCTQFDGNTKSCKQCENGYELYSSLTCVKSDSTYYKLSYYFIFIYLFFIYIK